MSQLLILEDDADVAELLADVLRHSGGPSRSILMVGRSFAACPPTGYRPEMTMSVEDYVAGFPEDVATRLQQVREVIVAEVTRVLGAAPRERVRYGMAAVMLDERGALHYAGWKHHIGIYPVHHLSPGLEAEVAPLRVAKDTVRLVHSRPLPLELLARIAAEVVGQYRC
jgi:uncharacterized protein YdhG (YjbR/CyaY superfamily)